MNLLLVYFVTLLLLSLYDPHILISAQSINVHHHSDSRSDALNAGFFVMVFAVLLAVMYYIVSKCINRYRGSPARETAHKAQRGLEQSILEAFPVFKYSEKSGLGLDKARVECAVCLSSFEEGETLRMLPKCKHVFHLDCVNSWLADHSTCPICRADLATRPSEAARVESGCVGGSGSGSTNEVANDVV